MKYPKKPPLVLTERERQVLENLAHARTIERRCGERATIILQLAAGTPKQAIAQQVHLTRKIVYLWYDRWLAAQERLHGAADASDKEFRTDRRDSRRSASSRSACDVYGGAGVRNYGLSLQKAGRPRLAVQHLAPHGTGSNRCESEDCGLDFSSQCGPFFKIRRTSNRIKTGIGCNPPRRTRKPFRLALPRCVPPTSRLPAWQRRARTP